MTKKTRIILLFICLILFLISAPLVALYSQGYRIDFAKKRFVKTGGFYFKIWPKGTIVFIDEKLEKKTDFFFGSSFIEDLLPKRYFVEVKKPGYQSWKKNLEIIEEKVTEAKNIFLIKEDLEFEFFDKDIKSFSFSPNEKLIIFQKEILSDEQKTWALKLYDLERKIKSHLVDEKEVSETGALLLDWVWAPNSESIILKTEIEAQTKFFTLHLEKTPIVLLDLNLPQGIENCYFHSTNPEKIFLTKEKEDSLILFEKGIGEENGNLLLEKMITFKSLKDDIFWISEQGFLQKSDLSGKSEKISAEPLLITDEHLQIEIFDSRIFFKENEKLFLFDEPSKVFREVGVKAESIKSSPDSKKICLWNEYELWVLFLKEELGQPQKEAEAKMFLTRFSKKIGEVFWWTSHYLIFNVNSEIKIIEIDDRDEIQIWNIADFKTPELYFNQTDKKLYILSQGDFFISKEMF